LLEIERGKRHEHGQGDDLLHDLELRHGETGLLKTDAIGGHLQQILKQGDTPAHQRGEVPRCGCQIFEVTVPGKGHEDIAAHEKDDGLPGQGYRLKRVHDENFPVAIWRAPSHNALITRFPGLGQRRLGKP
jgi:hypothetical protein